MLERSKKENECFGTPNNMYSWISLMYGVSLVELGDFKNGLLFIEKGHGVAIDTNNIINLAVSECFYGLYYMEKGDGEKAIEHFQKSIRYGEEGNYPWILALNRGYSGVCYRFLGDLYNAKEQIEMGQKIHRNTQVAWNDWMYPSYLGFIYHDLGDYVKAQMYSEEALELSKKSNQRQAEGTVMYFLGRIIGKRNPAKSEDAEKYILEGIKILEWLKTKPTIHQGYFYLGELYANSGRKDKALTNLHKALSMCQEMEIQYWPDKIQEVLDRI
jgi:tetratricopeptide (TPR) repeat protein